MSDTSFATASSIDLEIQPTAKVLQQGAYDNSLAFNRPLKRNDDPYYRIYSIDWMRIHTHLSRDNLKPLQKISLVAKIDRTSNNSFALWDVIFNNADRFNINACIFAADKDFNPIDVDNIVTKTNYSNIASENGTFKSTAFRSHLNRLVQGDHIGIGIFCVRSAKTYVLMYEIDGPCYIRPSNEFDRHDVPVAFPGFNCSLLYAIAVDSNGKSLFVSFGDDDVDVSKDTPFIQHIAQNVGDASDAYPWKAHFTPAKLDPYEFDDIKSGYSDTIEKATLGRYEDIEFVCRSIYRNLGLVETKRYQDLVNEYHAESAKRSSGKKKKQPSIDYNLPVADVYFSKDLITVVMKDSTNNSEATVISFNRSTMGHDEVVERYLSFKDVRDLGWNNVNEVTYFILEDGTDVFFRRLYMNY